MDADDLDLMLRYPSGLKGQALEMIVAMKANGLEHFVQEYLPRRMTWEETQALTGSGPGNRELLGPNSEGHAGREGQLPGAHGDGGQPALLAIYSHLMAEAAGQSFNEEISSWGNVLCLEDGDGANWGKVLSLEDGDGARGSNVCCFEDSDGDGATRRTPAPIIINGDRASTLSGCMVAGDEATTGRVQHTQHRHQGDDKKPNMEAVACAQPSRDKQAPNRQVPKPGEAMPCAQPYGDKQSPNRTMLKPGEARKAFILQAAGSALTALRGRALGEEVATHVVSHTQQDPRVITHRGRLAESLINPRGSHLVSAQDEEEDVANDLVSHTQQDPQVITNSGRLTESPIDSKDSHLVSAQDEEEEAAHDIVSHTPQGQHMTPDSGRLTGSSISPRDSHLVSAQDEVHALKQDNVCVHQTEVSLGRDISEVPGRFHVATMEELTALD
eukprot:gene10392-8335_t